MLTRLALALLATLVLAAPAAAAPAWLPTVELAPEVATTSDDAPTTSVAVAPDGTAVVAWTRQTGSGRVLAVARRAPGGTFSAIPTPAAGAARSAEVGIDADGDATVVWHEGLTTIRAARLPAGGSFESPQTLSTNGRYPAVAVGPGGTAVAVYLDLITQQVAAHIRATDGSGATFANPAVISPVASSFSAVHGVGVADVAVAPDGRAAVAWARYQSGAPSRYIVEVAERAPGAAFGLPADAADVSDEGPNASGTEPAVTIDPQGRTVVAWTHDADLSTETEGPVTVHAARSPLANAPVVASRDGVAAASPDLAVAGGEVVATWVAGANPARRIEAASCGGDPFDCTGHAFVSPEGNGDTRPIIAGNAAGAAMVAWHGFNSEGISSAFRPAGGSFGGTLAAESNAADPTRLRFTGPVIALDDEGNATALWSQIRLPLAPAVDNAYSVRGAGFDAVAPR